MSAFQPQPFGKYLLLERIGAGGMAEIFRALAFGVEGFTKEVCIKRILPTLTMDETFIRMFIDEAKIAVNLHHANIVQILDLGRIGEHYFIAMELVRGRDLLAIINRCRAQRKRLPLPVALYLMAEVCKGLDYAHRVTIDGQPAGIIHRDVSPSNILVSWEGEVKVADFGIAKAALRNERTITGTLKGKYGYMSPEQVQGRPIDRRSDIFAAGVLLWEALVAKRLFKGETDLDTLEAVRAVRVPGLPSKFKSDIPPTVDAIVARALSPRPEERFQTAAEMADAIGEQLYILGYRMDSKRLAEFMKDNFAAEIEAELRRQREQSHPELMVPPPEGPSPPTRLDLPPGVTTPVRGRRPLSAWALALLGSGLILAAGALVVLLVWLSQRPPAPPPVAIQTPPPPALSLPASIEIFSRPAGATVLLEGQPTGLLTPCRLPKLAGGRRYHLRLELPGYLPWEHEVELAEAQVLSLDAVLEKVPPPPVRPPPQPSSGSLSVSTVPVWAYVYIDGKKLDQPTPVYEIRLRPGEHTLRLVNPKLGLEKTVKVRIQAGKNTVLVEELK